MAAAREHLAKHAEHGEEKSSAAHAPTLISQPSRERTMPETAPSKSWKACRNTSESLRKKGSGGGKEKGQRRGKATLSRQIKNLSKQSLSDRSQKVVTFFVLLTSSKWCNFFLLLRTQPHNFFKSSYALKYVSMANNGPLEVQGQQSQRQGQQRQQLLRGPCHEPGLTSPPVSPSASASPRLMPHSPALVACCLRAPLVDDPRLVRCCLFCTILFAVLFHEHLVIVRS